MSGPKVLCLHWNPLGAKHTTALSTGRALSHHTRNLPKKLTYAHEFLHLLSLHTRLEFFLLGIGKSTVELAKSCRKDFRSCPPIHGA